MARIKLMVAPGCADGAILRLRAACAYSKQASGRVTPGHGNFLQAQSHAMNRTDVMLAVVEMAEVWSVF
jgi:hypothetical protein